MDVLEAYLVERKSPSFKSVLRHRCFIDHAYSNGSNHYQAKGPILEDDFGRAFKDYKSTPYEMYTTGNSMLSHQEFYDALVF